MSRHVRQFSRNLDEKTKDVIECLRAQPIQRERAIQQVLSVVQPLNLTQEHRPHERSPHLLQSAVQNMMEISMSEQEVQKRTYGLPASDNSINRQPITGWVQQEQRTHEFVTYAAITGYTHLNTHEIVALAERNLLLLDIIQSRRQLLEDILNQACATLMLSPEKIILSSGCQPLMTAAVEPAHITSDTLDYLSFLTRKHWEMVDNAPFDFLSNMLHHFQTIMRHQKEAYAHPLYRSFCSLAGEHALAIGRTLYDMREYNHSLSYCALSVKIALEIGNDDLRATGFGRMALVLLYSNQLESAHLYLQEAQRIHLQHPWIGAWLSAIEAELYAYAGNRDAFTRAMETSKSILARYPVGDDVYSSLTRFSSSMQLGFEGACLL